MGKWPVLLSIPHGGEDIPEEIAGSFALERKDILLDGDSFTREIYGIHDHVEAVLETPIARAVVDLNRDLSDRPPENPDGVVKSHTCVGKTVYLPNHFPQSHEIEALIEKYYTPYHQKIRAILDNHENIKIALDCHTMEAVGPEISPDPGQKRPVFCLGSNHGKSCPIDQVKKLAGCLEKTFDLEPKDIQIDSPFSGGFITRSYGEKRIPWIQIEMNRALYLKEPWFNATEFTVQSERLIELKDRFQHALSSFFK